MNATTTLIYPNLTTPANYHALLTQLTNTLMHETIMVRGRGGKVVNARRYELQAKIDAASAEGVARFGHKASCE